jgi:hypothetical protein
VVSYSLFNPSIWDFIIGRYKWDIWKVKIIFGSLVWSLKSLKYLFTLCSNSIFDSHVYLEILDFILSNNKYELTDYWLEFFEYTRNQQKYDEIRSEFLKELTYKPFISKNIAVLLSLIIKFWDKVWVKDLDFINKSIWPKWIDANEIMLLAWLYDKYDYDDESSLELLSKYIHEYLIDYLSDNDNSIDLKDYVSVDYDDYEIVYHINESGIIWEYEDIISEELNTLILSTTIKKLEIDAWDIAYDYYNESTIRESYIEEYWKEDRVVSPASYDYNREDYRQSIGETVEDKISDLFDKN